MRKVIARLLRYALHKIEKKSALPTPAGSRAERRRAWREGWQPGRQK